MFRGTCSIAETVADLDGLDVGSLDRSAVQAAFAELARVKGWHDGLHVRLTAPLARACGGVAIDLAGR